MSDARQVGCLRNVGESPCYGQHMDIRTLGMRLKEARKKKGLSMKEAAALVNYTYQWVDNVEGGRREPTIADLSRLAEAVDMRLIVELVPQTAWPSVSVPPPAVPSIEILSSMSEEKLAIAHRILAALQAAPPEAGAAAASLVEMAARQPFLAAPKADSEAPPDRRLRA